MTDTHGEQPMQPPVSWPPQVEGYPSQLPFGQDGEMGVEAPAAAQGETPAEAPAAVSAPARTAANQRRVGGWRRWVIPVALAGAGAAGYGIYELTHDDDSGNSVLPTATSEVPGTTAATTAGDVCIDKGTWDIEYANHDNNRWFGQGMQEIQDAQTPDQARAASNVWVDRVKRDPNLLSGATSFFLKQDVNPEAFKDGECVSSEAVKKAAELELFLTKAKITPDNAPANGINSGINPNTGQITLAASEGMSGNTKALRIDFSQDGKTCTMWIMARCGQIVTVKSCVPQIPHGPTDHPETPATTLGPKVLSPTPGPGTGGGTPITEPATPDLGQPNPVGGTLPPNTTTVTTRPAPTTTTTRPQTTNPTPVTSTPPPPAG